MAVLPTSESIAAYAADDDGGPVVMLNLLRVAGGDRALYDEYSRRVLPILAKCGAEVVYAGELSTMVIAPEVHGEWDLVLLVRYPSREAFMAMITDPEYLEVAELRSRGLEDSLLQATRELYAESTAAG
jgi:uncharacterized protein (DUF1330 family)